MAGTNGRQANPVGVDLSGDGLRAAQVEVLEAGRRLVDSVEDLRVIDSEDALRWAVARLLREGHFQGTRITTSIPADTLAIHHVRLPAMRGNKVMDALAAEVGSRLDYDVREAVIRHIEITPANNRDGHADYVVFTAQRHLVEQHLRMAEKLGLTMVGISALPLAVGHAFSYLGQRRDEAEFTFLVIHLDRKSTHLLIMHDGDLRFARTIPQGVHDIIAAVSAATGRETATLMEEQEFRMRHLDDHELLNSRTSSAPSAPHGVGPLPYERAGKVLAAYVEEIVACMCYFASAVSSRGVDKIIFTGPQANDYDFCQTVASRVGVPAQIGDPLAGIQVASAESGPGRGLRRPKPEMAVAIGLTLFGAMVN